MADEMSGRLVSRRQFLRSTTILAALALTAACGPSTQPAAKPAEPAKPAESKPAESKPAESKPAEAAKPAEAKPAAAQPTAAPAAQQAAPAAQAKPGDVPRNRTVVEITGSQVQQGKFTDAELWNPYAVGSNHQSGPNLIYEPLAYYSAFADKEHLWLAESYQYSPDSKQLTIKTRQGITWSDGKPFSAEDVVYTFNSLRDLGGKVRWGVDVQQVLQEARATDANTAVLTFKVPAPRFFEFVTYKYDIGVYIVPKHLFDGQDWTQFRAFDLGKDWPVTTGPWRVVYSAPEQKIFDRRQDWWAVKAGLVKQMPQMQRVVQLPTPGEQQLAQAHITNQCDFSTSLQPATFPTVLSQNPKIITHSGRDKPYGYVDWWPASLYLNTTVKPFDDPDVRWAISYYMERDQIVDVGWSGASSPSALPMPTYPPLKPYFEAVQDLLAKYPTTEFNPKKGDELLQNKGFKKEGGKWLMPDGQPFKLDFMGPGTGTFAAIGPVIQELLRRQGVEATYSQPPDATSRFEKGDYTGMIYGHGGSVRDPYYTLRLYQSATQAVPGAHLVNFPKWTNKKYDEIVDQVFVTPMNDIPKLQQLFHQAMEIWLPELPDVQLTEFYHRIPMNTTYWTNWPTAENPYVNGAFWHLTHQLVLNNLEAVQ
jgi:peptide/nickel transport system substrate-binding protein